MFLGRFILGQFVRVPFGSSSAGGVPSQPALPPIIAFYTAAGVKVTTGKMPPLDRVATTGLFAYTQQLDDDFEEGHYVAHVTSGNYAEVWHFDVLPGGDAGGAVLSQTFFSRPEAEFLVGKLADGSRFIARNPVEI